MIILVKLDSSLHDRIKECGIDSQLVFPCQCQQLLNSIVRALHHTTNLKYTHSFI